jgi:hypothetical protein
MKNWYIGEPSKGYISKYDINWKKGFPLLFIELLCFREKLEGRIKPQRGGIEAWQHFINAAKMLWPENDSVDAQGRRIVVSVKFVWHPWAVKIIQELCRNEVVAIAGGGGFGKSEVLATWLIINFLCDPKNTLCFATSTTIASSKKRIWGKIVRYWSAIEKQMTCGKLVDSAGMIRYVENGDPVQGDLAGITLVPAEKKKEKDALARLRGMHQKRIVFCADELGSLSPSVPEAAFMNLKLSADFFRFTGIDNPSTYTDAFGEIAIPVDGWNSISVEDEVWKTPRGICLHFDLTKNPNILEGRKVYNWMPTQEDIDTEMKVHGGNTAAFWQMYRGFWTPIEVSDQIYTEIEVVNAKGMEKAVWLNDNLVKISFLDPSFTNGGDRSIACFATVGMNLDGFKTLQFDEWLEFQEDMTDKTLTRSQQMVQWWRKACIDRKVAPRYAGYDATGGGGPFGDVVDVMFSRETFRLHFGKTASELPVSAYDPTPSNERYANAVTEIWYSGKEYLRSNQIRGIDKKMLYEMCGRKLDRSGERSLNVRLKVLPKSEMKSKFGMSPDYAEAAMGCLAIARSLLSLDSSTAIRAQDNINPGAKDTPSFKEAFRKFRDVYQAA